MLKDNHIDYAGGINKAIVKTSQYLKQKNLNLKVEIEARSLEDVRKIIASGGADRILLDNFSIDETLQAVKEISGRFETESSGGIDLLNDQGLRRMWCRFHFCRSTDTSYQKS